MTKNKFIPILLLLFAISLGIQAQEEVSKSIFNIGIEMTEDESLISFTATLVNNTSEPQEFRYEFITINRSQGGNNTSRQKGENTATPGEKMILSTSKIGINKDLIYDVRLFIYQADELVASDLLSSHENQKKTGSVTPGKMQDVNKTHEESQLGFGGLLLDETRTRAGRDFYEMFYTKWQELNIITDQNIQISEVFVRGRSTRVSIAINDQLLFVSGLQPRYDIIESRVSAALPRVASYIERQKNLNQDLETGDQAGSGIF